MKVRNWPLLFATVEQVLSNPKNWSQDTWIGPTECGTTMCIAGWASKLAGHDHSEFSRAYDFVRIDGDEMYIESAGAEALGLDPYGEEVEELFYNLGTDREDLLELIKEWAQIDGVDIPAWLQLEMI